MKREWTVVIRGRDGHAFDTENTYIHPKRGSRLCRTCNRESVAAYKLRRAAA